MTPNNLSKLPVDLLSEVLSGMTIEDIINLRVAARADKGAKPVDSECERMMSVSRYLKETLGYGVELLTILSKCFAYIGGSRSLEFFVPGCIDESSDLDIYVPNMTNMGKAMRLLADLGVRWHSVENDIRKCVERGEGEVLVGGSSLLSLRTSNILQNICRDAGFKLEDFLHVHSMGMIVIKIENRTIETNYAPDGMGYSEPSFFGMANGTLYHKKKEIKVQLMCERRPSGLMGVDGLGRYHSSCVQSFIAGHMACHLHGKMASRMLTYGWAVNVSDVEFLVTRYHEADTSNIKEHGKTYIIPGWVKYEGRGFRYIPSPGPTVTVHRTLFDSDCTTIKYPEDVGAPTVVSDGYRRSAESTWWCQTNNGITGVWTSHEIQDMSGGVTEHSWFSSTDVHKDQWYLHQHHVAYTSLIFDNTEIVPEIN